MIKIALASMVVLALVALGAGPLLYQDRIDPTVPQEAMHRLKTQIAAPYEMRPLVLQVTEARMTGNTPDHVEGTGVWRTLFGISVGKPRLAYNDGHYDLDVGKWFAVWAIFLLVEGALGTFVLQRALR